MAKTKKRKTTSSAGEPHKGRPSEKERKESRSSAPHAKPGARPIWSGFISFGLVNIPIKVVAAIREKGVHFHQLHEKDSSRIQYRTYCAQEEKEVPKSEIVKGYEVGAGQYVVVSENELRALEPKATRGLEIVNFVRADEVDPLFYDRGYYVVPDKNADKAYLLLLDAMKKTGMAALAKMVMRAKEYIAIVRPEKNVLSLETMHFADEVVRPQDLGLDLKATPSEAESRMATQLVQSLAASFDPAKIKDDYRLAVMDLIDKKSQGQEVVLEPQAREEPEVIDLMSALQKSIDQSKKRGERAA